jgi:hypothetical protein
MVRFMDAAGRQILAVSHFTRILNRTEAEYMNMKHRFDCEMSHGTHAKLNRCNLISRNVPQKSQLVLFSQIYGKQG